MKPLLLLVALFITVAWVSNTSSGGSDAAKSGLLGKVRSVENWKVEYVSRKPAGELMKQGRPVSRHDSNRCMVIYDEYGKLIEAIYLDEDSMQQRRDDYKYDVDGRLDEIILDASNQSDFPTKLEYRYNKDGQLREQDYYSNRSNSDERETWYDYDSSGYVSTIYKRTIGVKYNEIIEFKHDADGKILQADDENGDNELMHREVYRYDSADHLIEAVHYRSDGSTVYKQEEYSYNDDGKKVEQIDYTYFPVDSVRKSYEYYFNYKVVEETDNDYVRGTVKTERDSLAVVYDSVGNWVKQAHYLNSKDSSIMYRKISYY